jgi:hypothetical protein
MRGPVLVDTDPGIDDALALHNLVARRGWDFWFGSATRLGRGRAWPANTSLDISSPRWMRRQPYSKEVGTWQTQPVRPKEGSSPG